MPTSPHTLARHCAPRTVIHLDAHRPVVMVRDPGDEPTAIEAADQARRSYPQAERRQHDYHPLGCDNQGRHPERAHPTDGAHAVSEVGQPPPVPPRATDSGEWERMPRRESTLFWLAVWAGPAAVVLIGLLAWLRGFFG